MFQWPFLFLTRLNQFLTIRKLVKFFPSLELLFTLGFYAHEEEVFCFICSVLDNAMT